MNNKQIIIAGSIVIVMILVSIIWWSISPSWEPLFPVDLSDSDKTSVTNVLTEAGIAYKMDDSAKKILVKSEDSYKAHGILDVRGVPQKDGVGLEMFNNADYGLSEFVQGINYQRAMEEELVRSIRLIKGVKDARVHLAIKKQSIFEEKKEPPKASVILTFKDGASLNKEIVKGIQQIIAASIPSLTAESIVILSDDGRLLSHGESDADLGETSSFEQKYTNSITQLLVTYLGHTHFQVAVDVKADKRKKVTVAENYFPDSRSGKGFVLKTRQSEKNAETEVSEGRSQNQNLKEEEFAYSKERSETVFPVGEIMHVSAAIVIQGDISSGDRVTLRELIFSGLGMDENRGDSVTIAVVNRGVNSQEVNAKSATGITWAEREKKDANASSTVWITSRNLMLLGVSALFFILSLVSFFIASRRGSSSHRRLSTEEKEKLLSDLKEWMR